MHRLTFGIPQQRLHRPTLAQISLYNKVWFQHRLAVKLEDPALRAKLLGILHISYALHFLLLWLFQRLKAYLKISLHGTTYRYSCKDFVVPQCKSTNCLLPFYQQTPVIHSSSLLEIPAPGLAHITSSTDRTQKCATLYIFRGNFTYSFPSLPPPNTSTQVCICSSYNH